MQFIVERKIPCDSFPFTWPADMFIFQFTCLYSLSSEQFLVLNTFTERSATSLIYLKWVFRQLQKSIKIFDSDSRWGSPKAGMVWWRKFSPAFPIYTMFTLTHDHWLLLLQFIFQKASRINRNSLDNSFN